MSYARPIPILGALALSALFALACEADPEPEARATGDAEVDGGAPTDADLTPVGGADLGTHAPLDGGLIVDRGLIIDSGPILSDRGLIIDSGPTSDGEALEDAGVIWDVSFASDGWTDGSAVGECPPEAPRDRLGCRVEGLECAYPRGECPCGDPSDYFICRGGAFVLDGSESGCENSADECNGPACDNGPGGACAPEGEDCWFEDGVDEASGMTIYRRWRCDGGALISTEQTHINVI